MWREKQSLWDVMYFFFRERNEKYKSLKRLRFLIERYPLAANRGRCSLKKVFLKTSQNSQENTCVRVCF